MAKKSFKDNPALQFITAADQEEPEQQEAAAAPPAPQAQQPERAATIPPAPRLTAKDAPEGYKVNPAFIEKKSRRLQLIMQPSLYNKIKARADQNKTSVNEFIHSILEEAMKEG